MQTQTVFGWPVVTAESVFRVVTEELGIKPWKQTRPSMPLTAWLQQADERGQTIYEKFGPKPQVQFLAPPKEKTDYGDEDIFFRMGYKPWVTVFALIPGPDGKLYVAVTAEWKQGNHRVTLVPVSGIAGKAEAGFETFDAMRATALREFWEETGINLADARIIGSHDGYWDQVHGTELRFFACLGTVKEPVVRGESKLDRHEFLKLVLFELGEWRKLLRRRDIDPRFGIESCAVTTTYLCLEELGMIHVRSQLEAREVAAEAADCGSLTR